MGTAVLITCEHAGRRVPRRYQQLFAGAESVLDSHEGWDPGAWPLARFLARTVPAPLLATHWTRLLVEPNRSSHHPALFSRFTKILSRQEKQQLLARYYAPHRKRVESWIQGELSEAGLVLHVGVHTFTPRWRGTQRRVDVGLLYDPRRPGEPQFAARWQQTLRAARPDLQLRRNNPYRGGDDGLTTYLRRQFPAYWGLELEVNQAWWLAGRPTWHRLCQDLARSLVASLEAMKHDGHRSAPLRRDDLRRTGAGPPRPSGAAQQ